jgi:NifB/MoaA-like Fe-S oxidoreductase
MVPITLGYTSGNGFKTADDAEQLIKAGVREVSFTVFSTRPELRRRYMGDKNAEIALENLKTFCESCDVYCASVLLPGVNDGEELERTASDLRRWVPGA